MDEDDSQDELVNRSSSQGKGKRAALWAISDDSDSVEGESEGGESDSGEGEEEGHLDGEDDDEEEEEEDDDDEEDDEEEEGDAKAEDGAFGGTSLDLAEMSSDEDTERCPICLNSFSSQPVATPENCEHYFCLDCILAWAKNANSCPVDRIAFNSIYLRKCFGGKVKKMITVQKPAKEEQVEVIDLELDQTSCEVCGGRDREDRLLLCDGCDAGYHMECLTPALDSVPVEEWFCPECEASNRHSRVSAEELSETESLPSTARPATSRFQSGAAGPTRAIARTQQSERVRANVNRHRITQARTSQLAPTFLIQSTWLDETINAVVAGLNTAVYVRDFTSRVPSSTRRKTRKRRKVRRKNTSANGKAASTGVKKRRRKGRRTKSRRKLMKKTATPRSRIANSLRIGKDKKNSSLPTVYRPSENTLSNMRADIGAASLSIYGDPFDLDPFVDREEEGQQARVTSLLEAKRRGISRSALRSHQPVARPVTAGHSRRGMDVPGGVVEAAPVPDLLGSILSGQSVLLMDSSDVIINRDGSLKATKQDVNLSPVMSPSHGDSSPSLHYNGDLPGSSHSSTNRPFSPHLPPHMPSSASHSQPSSHSDLPPRGLPSLQPPHPVRPTLPPGHRRTSSVGAPSPSSSIPPTQDSSSKSKGGSSSQSQPKKAPIKPMWVDVSVLPRIPKIKREDNGVSNDGTSQGGSIGFNQSSSRRGNGSNSSSGSNGYGEPGMGVNSLAGDKGKQHSVDQQKGRPDGPAQRQRSDGAGSSSAFSNSFSSSSVPTGSSVSHPRYSMSSSSSSSSSAVSFRINSSGNSWQSRRLSSLSSSAAGGSSKAPRREKEDEAKKRQLHRDKQMLLASRTLSDTEKDTNTIYDPFDPTLSDSSSSDHEADGPSRGGSSRHATHEGKAPRIGNEGMVQSKRVMVPVKAETQEIEASQEEPSALETTSQEVRLSQTFVKVKKESTSIDIKTEKQTLLLPTKIKKEPALDDAGGAETFSYNVKSLKSETVDATPPLQHSLDLVKTEGETLEEESGPSVGAPNSTNNSSASSSGLTKTKQKPEMKPHSKSSPKSRDLDHKKKTSHASKDIRSSSSETDRGKRGDHHASGQGGRLKEKEKDRERSSRRSRSRERRRRRSSSSSESSQSNSPDGSRRKRRRSRSRSKDRRRSRSGSSSSSKERSRRKKSEQRSKERNDGRDCDRRRVSKDKRHDRSRSKSRSRSRSRSKDHKRVRSRSKSRSRSRSRSKDHKRVRSRSKSRSRSRERRKGHHTGLQQSSLSSRDKVESSSKDKRRHRSRSSSREKRKEEASSSKSSQKTSGSCVSSSKDTKQSQGKKKEKTVTQHSLKVDQIATVNKPKTPSCTATLNVRRKGRALTAEGQAKTAEMVKEVKVEKEIKKEKQSSLDMFEEAFSLTKPMEEETDFHPLLAAKSKDEEANEDSIKTEPLKIKTEPLKIKTEPLKVKTEPPKVKTEPLEIKTEPLKVKTEPLKVETEPPKVKTEPPKVKTEPLKVKTEPLKVKTEPLKVKTEPLKVKTEPPKVKTEPPKVKTEPPEIKVDTKQTQIPIIKSEPGSPELGHLSPVPARVPADGLKDPASQSHPELMDTVELTTPVKQEVQQPSDSDDDFNVDVMLDNLDYVKSQRTDSVTSVKQEKEVEAEKNEPVSAVVGVKSKTQVKRVTWNIQEPEGPQPEKSASKLALYKLKLKQEGARRPSSTVQTSGQDITGAASKPSKRDADGPLSTSSRSAVQGEADEGDPRKDQYLKKLHMQERAIEEVKLAIKPFYQRRDITKDEYKEILRKAVQKVCHSKSGEINPVKVGNLVKAYVDKYKHARKHTKGEGESLEAETMTTP